MEKLSHYLLSHYLRNWAFEGYSYPMCAAMYA